MAQKQVIQAGHAIGNAEPRSDVARLLVADQSLMNCQLLVGALRRCRRIEIVARATSSDQLLTEVQATRPSVALISAHLQEGSLAGFAIVRRLRSLHPGVRAILLLDSAERGWVIDAFRAGAKGIFCREDPLGSLCKCVQSVHMGQTWASSQQIADVLDAFARVAPPTLTDARTKVALSRREQEVAELIAEGLSNRDVSIQLGLSEHTVKNYLFHIFEKLGISSRLELVLYSRSLEKNEADSRRARGQIGISSDHPKPSPE
jgi:two-component system, NarL family, nitrate/nitrite response regulator NarL